MARIQPQIEALYAGLTAKRIPKACAGAINRTLDEGKTLIVRALSNEVTLKAASVREVVRVEKVNETSVAAGKTGHIKLSDQARPLFDFPHREGKKGITVRVRKGKPAEKYRHYFTAKMKSGHEGIYGRVKGRDKGGTLSKGSMRRGSGKNRGMKLTGAGYARRLPIREIMGPSLVEVFKRAGTIAEKAIEGLTDIFIKNLKSQFARFTRPRKPK